MIPFESYKTLFLVDVERMSKMGICSLEGMKSDLSKVLGEVRNTMASYLFFHFLLRTTALKYFNEIVQLHHPTQISGYEAFFSPDF